MPVRKEIPDAPAISGLRCSTGAKSPAQRRRGLGASVTLEGAAVMLSLADVGVTPIAQGPVAIWLTEEEARLIGFTEAEIEAAKAAAP